MSTSSSGSITTSTVNGVSRLTGLSSGLDVDGIVEKLVAAEKEKKLNKLEREEQKAEWQQEAYQSVISEVQDFTSTYFDVSGSKSLIVSDNFLKYSASSSDNAVSVSASTSAEAGSHTVSVSQLATKATLTSSSSISKNLEGTKAPDYSSIASGESFVLTVDGTAKTISLDTLAGVTDTSGDGSTSDEALKLLQTAIDNAVGSGKITADTTSDGYLELTAADSGVQKITVSATSTSATDGITNLFGSSSSLSNRISTSDTIQAISSELNSTLKYSNTDGEIILKINGTAMTFDKSDTLAEMMSEINDAGLGVTMSYNSLTGKLVMIADDTGAGTSITVADEGDGNFAALLLPSSNFTAGTDAKCTIDGQSFTRSSNTITVDGITYTLNSKTTTATSNDNGTTDTSDDTTTTTDNPATITVTQDTDGVYDLISNFIDGYNTLIEKLNDLIDENADSDYQPLTDDQKDDMTDEQVSKWEAKAKVGLLENDSIISEMLSEMRDAIVDSVSGISSGLSDIGIETSDDWDDNGKLEIDETATVTLKEAIASDPEAIMKLFTQEATSKGADGTTTLSGTISARKLSTTDAATRYKEEGIGWRIYDILQKNISTITDNSSNKGYLLEKAGIDGDSTETDNELTSLIDKYADEIDEEEDRIDEYEDKLYDKYSTLETYINKMNSQLSALSSMTG